MNNLSISHLLVLWVYGWSKQMEESVDFGKDMPALRPGGILDREDVRQWVLRASGQIDQPMLDFAVSQQLGKSECVAAYQVFGAGNEIHGRQLSGADQRSRIEQVRQVRLTCIPGVGDQVLQEKEQVAPACIQHDGYERCRAETYAGGRYAEGLLYAPATLDSQSEQPQQGAG